MPSAKYEVIPRMFGHGDIRATIGRHPTHEISERYGNQTGSVGPGRPTLGTRIAERFGVMRKVAPRVAENQEQHLLCEWVIEASTLRPCDPTHEMCYRFVAVHGGPLAKMSGRGATTYCGQILKPCRKARRHVGCTVWDYCEMLAHRMGHGLKIRS
ncbi:UNVERIFIED_CONTAM: hypothetical protein Sradi_3300900 [Sesamum radiatum]|uniref:Uncharacterized protein n=1 Tax=Sesamum radiatum TaxID=300843 RepID=A0AAW2R199_SESRA